MRQKSPIFLFAFANDAQGSLRLEEEQNACWKELAALDLEGKIGCEMMGFASLEQVYREFSRLVDQVYLFHYGGHSSSEVIKLHGTPATAKHLGAKIGQQSYLKLVFLNGCKNYEQVDLLFQHGVPAVIATTADIQDHRAIILAQQFYQALAGGNTLAKSFESAKNFIFDKYPELIDTYRSVGLRSKSAGEGFAWGLYTQDDFILDWHLGLVGQEQYTVNRFLTRLPILEDDIVGREDDIEGLHEALEKSRRVVLMNGMGGIGKTTTAIAYANQFKDQYRHIAWIEQVGDFTTDLSTNSLLTKNLGITLSNNPTIDTQIILNELSNLGGPSLLVIDNGNEQINSFKDYLPKSPKWQILITSRQELSFAKILPLGFLTEQEALKLFYQHYRRDKDDGTAKKILRTIDYHTLTLELLAKTAQKRHIKPLTTLSELLQKRGIKIGRRVDFSIGHSGEEKVKMLFPYLKAIFQLDATITEGEQVLMKQFIGLTSTFIPLNVLVEILQIDRRDEEVFDALTSTLDKLKEKGWIVFDTEQQAYKMHSIIQDVLQAQLKLEYGNLNKIVQGLSIGLFIDHYKDNPILKFQLVRYAERLLFLFPDIEESEYLEFQSNLAMVYLHLGRCKEGASLQKKALGSAIKKFGNSNPKVTKHQSNLAILYRALGRYEEAADLQEKVLESGLKTLDPEDPNLAERRSNLALVYMNLGRYQEAAKLLEKALESVMKKFDPNHPRVAKLQSNLATIYDDLGRYEEAAILIEKALESGMKNLDPNHPVVTLRRSNLAAVYMNLGRYEGAAELLEKVLGLAMKNFDLDHPRVAKFQSNLATAYFYLKRFEEAAILVEKALDSAIKNFGPDHPSVALRRMSLAVNYGELKRHQEAANLLEKALDLHLSVFGSEHPNVARCQSNLAVVYLELERHQEAANLLEKAMASSLKTFGPDHPDVAIRQSNLARAYLNLGRLGEAIIYWRKSYQIFHTVWGVNHPRTKKVEELLKEYDK